MVVVVEVVVVVEIVVAVVVVLDVVVVEIVVVECRLRNVQCHVRLVLHIILFVWLISALFCALLAFWALPLLALFCVLEAALQHRWERQHQQQH